ncbi:MAG: copper chaperone PCu(A)C [Agarilytica sp.]
MKLITSVGKALALLASCQLMLGCSEPLPEVSAHDVFIFELPPDKTSAAAYLTLKNNSERMHALNYVHSSKAEWVEIRHSFHRQGTMESKAVKRLRVSPGEIKQLKPGSFHLMVFGLYDALKAGEHFDITLEFETGHVIETQVEVRSRN